MSRHPVPAEPAQPLEPFEVNPPSSGGQTAVDEPRDHTQHYRDVLRELVDIGTDIARMFHDHAKLQHQFVDAGAQPLVPIDFSVPYESLTRSIRRTIALARKLDQPVDNSAQSRAASRRQIIREVEDAIERQPSDTPSENLRDELRTRLDAPDLEDDIDTRPIADIIAEICHDLGLDHTPGSPPLETPHTRGHRTPLRPRHPAAKAPAAASNPHPQLSHNPGAEKTAVLF